MKTYTFFHNLKLRIRRLIERLKEERSKIDGMGEKVTKSIKEMSEWGNGAKRQNWPGAYPPFDRSPNARSKKIY